MSIIGSNILAGAAGSGVSAYEIEQSLRFNSGDSTYLNRTPGTAGNRNLWTWSAWVKRSQLGVQQALFQGHDTGAAGGGNENRSGIHFDSSDRLYFQVKQGGTDNYVQVRTTAVYRDPSAWYHVVVVLDTSQGTTAPNGRIKMYVNGQQVETFDNYSVSNLGSNVSYINNTDSHWIGARIAAAEYFNGYLAEVNFIDGSALDHEDFGELDDNGVWRPIKYAGSYTGNSFYLKFASGDGTDSSGLSNTWTANNFTTSGTGTDVMSDTPTTNYATLNPIFKENTGVAGGTFANGNLEHSEGSANFRHTVSTQALPSSGKVYVEVEADTLASSYGSIFGLMLESRLNSPDSADNFGIYCQSNGTLTIEGSNQGSVSAGDVFSLSVDMDASPIEIVVRKNGTVVGSNPYTLSTTETLFFWSRNIYGSKLIWNFGQRAFEQTQTSGYKTLNTSNLPAPDIADGSDYFQTITYNGTQTTTDFTVADNSGNAWQPDFVWIKSRNDTYWHRLFDAVRGATKQLYSNDTSNEQTVTNGLTSFNSDGFTLGDSGGVNEASGKTYVAWNWKAGGSGSSNTDGSITSTVSVNATAGFSIVTYTGDGDSAATVGHGLGVSPNFVMLKRRTGGLGNWQVGNDNIFGNYELYLNTQDGITDGANEYSVTSTVIDLNSSHFGSNANGSTYVAYCFAEVEGYSKFGTYTGNGSSDGPFIYTGFKPAWLMVKSNNGSTDWKIYDAGREPYNVVANRIAANTTNAELDGNAQDMDFVSNGFKFRGTNGDQNSSGTLFHYVAFASSPFGGSGVSPVTAR